MWNHAEAPIRSGDRGLAVVYQEWDFPSCVIEAWKRLSDAYGTAGLFLSPEWFERWWSALGRGGRLFVIVFEEQGEVQGIFPCWIGGLGHEAGEGTISSLTNDHTFYFDFLIQPGASKRIFSDFVRFIQRTRPRFKMAFECLGDRYQTGSELGSEMRRFGFPTHRCVEDYGTYLGGVLQGP